MAGAILDTIAESGMKLKPDKVLREVEMVYFPYVCRTGCGRVVADAGGLCRRCRERERMDEAIERANKRLEELEE